MPRKSLETRISYLGEKVVREKEYLSAMILFYYGYLGAKLKREALIIVVCWCCLEGYSVCTPSVAFLAGA